MVVLCYLAGNLLYSFGLKRVRYADMALLSLFYPTRVWAGGAAAGVGISPWLFTFTAFFFLSLSLPKRHAELARGLAPRRSGRGYGPAHRRPLFFLGAVTTVAAGLVLALYPLSDTARLLYREPVWLWVLPVVVTLWLARLWRRSAGNRMPDDPVTFTLADPLSWAACALCALAAFTAI